MEAGQQSSAFEVYAKRIDAQSMEIRVRASTEFEIGIDDTGDASVIVVDDATDKAIQGTLQKPGEYYLRAEIADSDK